MQTNPGSGGQPGSEQGYTAEAGAGASAGQSGSSKKADQVTDVDFKEVK